MSYDRDVELLDEYNKWVIARKALAADLTPDAFLVDKTKQDAADRVFEAIDYIENNLGVWNNEHGFYQIKGMPATKIKDAHVVSLERILRGSV